MYKDIFLILQLLLKNQNCIEIDWKIEFKLIGNVEHFQIMPDYNQSRYVNLIWENYIFLNIPNIDSVLILKKQSNGQAYQKRIEI